MSEPRTKHLSIDGGQVKEDEHVASYKPLPDSDTNFRSSKSSLTKSKDKVSPDGAEEKLLAKEDEAKIVRVDMADAKYVVGDHRNGDAKIELDANKRQFSGLTKEELLKYADDPFWVNLRWFMFILFWAMWLCMLAGAIAIIVRAPKCARPTPRTWFEKGPLVDLDTSEYAEIEAELPLLKSSKIQAVFMEVPTYDPLDNPQILENFKAFVAKAKEYSIKVIVDLTPNFVSIDHQWFQLSVNRSAEYLDYFVWASGKEFDDAGKQKPPNNWVSTVNTPAWSYNEHREQFYLHQYGAEQADLNFNNERVVAKFISVLEMWMKAGAEGVRLNKARQLLVNATLHDEVAATGRGSSPAADHTSYAYWRHRHTSDLPQLDSLLARFAAAVDASSATPGAGDTVFTLNEEGGRPELFLLERNVTSLRPASAAPISVANATEAAREINERIAKRWPAIQLRTDADAESEIASFALLLPATPVFSLAQLDEEHTNDTASSELLSHLVPLRSDASIEHGHHAVLAVPAGTAEPSLLACARWKPGHSGYVAIFNPTSEPLHANLTAVAAVPESVTVHHVSHAVKMYTNYSTSPVEPAERVPVPARSTVVLAYVPRTAADN